MQQLDQDGVYVARWGVYLVQLTVTRGMGTAEVRRIEDGGPPLAKANELPRRTVAEAIAWAAERIEQAGGSQIFIDGQERRLVDFLAFERMTAAAAWTP